MVFKKAISIILALVIALGSVIPAFAEDTVTAESESTTQTESEPNNDIESANKLDVHRRCEGSISDEDDVDYYCFNAIKGGAVINLFNTGTSEDSENCDITLEFFQISNGKSISKLAVTKITLPVGETSCRSEVIGVGYGTYYVSVRTDDGKACSYAFIVWNLNNIEFEYETEYNNDISHATSITYDKVIPASIEEYSINRSMYGTLSDKDDVDFYKTDIELLKRYPDYVSVLIGDTDIVESNMVCSCLTFSAPDRGSYEVSILNSDMTVMGKGTFDSNNGFTFSLSAYDFGLYYIYVKSGGNYTGGRYIITESVEKSFSPEKENELINFTPLGAEYLGCYKASSSKIDTDFYCIDSEKFIFYPQSFDSKTKWKIKVYNEYGMLIDIMTVQGGNPVTLEASAWKNYNSSAAAAGVADPVISLMCAIKSFEGLKSRLLNDRYRYYISVTAESDTDEEYTISCTHEESPGQTAGGWAAAISKLLNRFFSKK